MTTKIVFRTFFDKMTLPNLYSLLQRLIFKMITMVILLAAELVLCWDCMPHQRNRSRILFSIVSMKNHDLSPATLNCFFT